MSRTYTNCTNPFLLNLCAIIFFATNSTFAASLNKTLIYCSENSPIGFDPGQAKTLPDFTASAPTLYNRLVEYERGSMKIQPGLAERWTISNEGRVYSFYLRHGVKFHTTPWFKPTRELNAEDVLFTFERMRNPSMPFRKAYPTEFPDFYYTGLDKIISNIETPDPYTVRFTLNRAHAPFLFKLAQPSVSILSSEYAMQLLKAGNPSDISKKPVGTGPFIFQKYIKDAKIRFKGNPEYWNPNDVRLSALIFDIAPNAATRTQKLKAHECQVASNLLLTNLPDLEQNPDLRVLNQPGFNMIYLAYNTTHKPLNDVRVRRALDMAIDKKVIINHVYEGRAQIAIAPMPPLQWSYDKNLKDAPRNLKKAKALLARAGYPNGFTLSLWAPLLEPNRRLMAEMIQADWKKIGIKAHIMSYELGEYYSRAMNGEHDALLVNVVSNIPDPDNWLNLLNSNAVRTGDNFSRWRNKSFDGLIQRAAQMSDVAERTQLYLKAQKIFKREQPFTPIAYATDYQVINKRVTGFKINPLGPTIFSDVGLSPPLQTGSK